MMRIRSLDLSEADEWEGWVRSCGGHALHLPCVHVTDHDPSHINLLGFEDDSGLVACAIGISPPRGRLGWLKRGGGVLVLPTAPALRDPERGREVRQALFAHARSTDSTRLIIQPGYSTWLTDDEDLERYRVRSITEFIIDLRRDHEQILAGMHKIHRKNIRRADRAELEITEDSSLAGLLRLREMQLASSARADARTEGFAVQEERFFRHVHEQVYDGGPGAVLFAHLEGEPVAALAWLQAAGRLLTVRSGSLPSGYQSRAMYLLHDALIRRALADSAVELNIGAVPHAASDKDHAQFGLFEFKSGFGGQPLQRFGLDIPLKEIAA